MHPMLNALFRILTVYLGATLTFFTMSALDLSSTASFYARTLASYGCLLLCAIYGLIASIVFRLIGAHRSAQWATARAFKWTMALTTGVTFEIVEGQEHLDTRPMVLIGNHQSELDVLLLGAIFPKHCAVTAKSSLKLTPFLGQFMALSGTVFINRSDRMSSISAFAAAAAEMKKHRQSVFIFPEGTRSYAKGPNMGAFKKGAFHLAVQAGVPVVPVVCANYWGVLAAGEKRFRAGKIPVKVLPPIPTANLTAADVDHLTESTRDLMLKELVELTNSPLGQKATKATVNAGEEDLAHLATAGAGVAKGKKDR